MNRNSMTKPAAAGSLMDRLLSRVDDCNLWASLQPVHDATGNAIITLMTSAEAIYTNICKFGRHELATAIYAACVKDMNQAVSEVEAIHSQWSHRSGFATTQDDHVLMAKVSDQYTMCNDRFQQLSIQNVMELTTILAGLASDGAVSMSVEDTESEELDRHCGPDEETVVADEVKE